MDKGVIFNIQHFSINDGPGIRTTVFFKGCPLRCIWCHNPESYRSQPQLMYLADKCVGCGRCASACKNAAHKFDNGVHTVDHTFCTACGRCAEACVYNALEIVGREYSVDEVLENVLRDRKFYVTSGGGITLSGGEPFMQFNFMLSLLKKSKEAGLHVCIETSGHTQPDNIKLAAEYTDIFLYDFKESTPELHREFTGADNTLILNNLALLDRLGKNIILRCPIIPGLNLRDEHLTAIIKTANKYLSIYEIDIEGYHPLGISKNSRLGYTPKYRNENFCDRSEIERCAELIRAETRAKVVIG